MSNMPNPRSTLHALVPLGLGTPDVESLSSYFCRLAHSHGMTARHLAVWMLGHCGQAVPDDFKWSQRSFSSLSEETEQWAAWISALTGVEALDELTLVPWRHLLAGPGLTAASDRWCPCCLQDDQEAGRSPYLRLVWDVAQVAACTHHKVGLVSSCPHCHKSNVRNRAATVVPGYCTACGGFLGAAVAAPASPETLWVARQVGRMIACRPTIAPGDLTPLLETVVERISGGKVARFSRKIGMSKSGIWHWVKKGGQPTLRAWLAIALHGGIGLDKLFAGDIDDWVVPGKPVQMPIPSLEQPRKGIRSRMLDWDVIRKTLQAILEEPEPISLGEACRRVGVDYKHLYLRANVEARAIADRYRRFQALAKKNREEGFQQKVFQLLNERRKDGYEGLSARDIQVQMAGTELANLRHAFTRIREIRAGKD